jgi:hypothetical protein
MSLWLALTPTVSHTRGCAAPPDASHESRDLEIRIDRRGLLSSGMFCSEKSAQSADDFLVMGALEGSGLCELRGFFFFVRLAPVSHGW